jgi:mannose-6-phosphate isomerase
LEGQNVEIMANSDNVLRGGLTTKHIDVKELLKHVSCEATDPGVISAEAGKGVDKIYKTPVRDFLLSVFELNAGDTVSFTPETTEIVLLVKGRVELVRKDSFGNDDRKALMLQPGSPCAAVFPGQEVFLSAAATSLVFRASTTVDK